MVRDDNGRLSLWKHIARHGDLCAIEDLEDDLDPFPTCECNERGSIVDPGREKVADREKGRYNQIHEDQFQSPWYNDHDSPQGREEMPGRHVDG